MAEVLAPSLRELQKLAQANARAVVLYSGGKDSLAVMDLACRVWPARNVVAVNMFFVPGLAVVEERLDFARRQWPGVNILSVPHWASFRYRLHGVYCVPQPSMPEIKLQGVIQHVRDSTGIPLVLHGGKKADGGWRRRSMKACDVQPPEYPVKDWNKWDVLAYLKSRGIEAFHKFDIGLGIPVLLWMHDSHPDDFALLEREYPFIRAVVRRRDWYGLDA